MTRKTGSQRRYPVFVSMLVAAIDNTSSRREAKPDTSGVKLDILFVDDLERMRTEAGYRQEAVEATIQNVRSNSRCFLVVAYTVEFENTFYPLSLNKSEEPSTPLEEWLAHSYRLVRAELRRLQERGTTPRNAHSASKATADEIASLKATIERLETEKRTALRAAEIAVSERNKIHDQLSRQSERQESGASTARSSRHKTTRSAAYDQYPEYLATSRKTSRSQSLSRHGSRAGSATGTITSGKSSRRHRTTSPAASTRLSGSQGSARSLSASLRASSRQSPALVSSRRPATSYVTTSSNPYRAARSVSRSLSASEFSDTPTSQYLNRTRADSSSRRHRSRVEEPTRRRRREHRSAEYYEEPQQTRRSGSRSGSSSGARRSHDVRDDERAAELVESIARLHHRSSRR